MFSSLILLNEENEMGNKSDLKNKKIKVWALLTFFVFQAVSLPASAENSLFEHALQNSLDKKYVRSQFEIGINIPLGRAASTQLKNRSHLYASYFLPGQNQRIGIGFTHGLGNNAGYQYVTRFSDSENKIDMSLPLYTYNKTVLNASSTASTTVGSTSYTWLIGAGLLVLAAAGSGGGGDDALQASPVNSFSESALSRYEKAISLPVCSPIPPADGNEEPCRNI